MTKTERVACRLSQKEKAKLTAMAKQSRRSVSEVLRLLVEQAVSVGTAEVRFMTN